MAQAFDSGAFEITAFEAGSGGPPSQFLTPARFNNTNNFFAATVAMGAVTLTQGARFDSSQTFFAPTVVRGAVTLTAARFDNANTFFGHAVTLGPVTLRPPLYGNVETFYAPTVARGSVTLAAGRFDNAQTFYTHFVTQGGPSQSLQPPLLTNTQAFYTHTLTSQAPELRPPLITNTNTFFEPKLNLVLRADNWVDSGWVEPGWVGWPYFNTNQFFAPTVNRGAVTLVQASRLDNAQFFYPPFVGDAPQVDDGRNVSGGMLVNMGTLMSR